MKITIDDGNGCIVTVEEECGVPTFYGFAYLFSNALLGHTFTKGQVDKLFTRGTKKEIDLWIEKQGAIEDAVNGENS